MQCPSNVGVTSPLACQPTSGLFQCTSVLLPLPFQSSSVMQVAHKPWNMMISHLAIMDRLTDLFGWLQPEMRWTVSSFCSQASGFHNSKDLVRFMGGIWETFGSRRSEITMPRNRNAKVPFNFQCHDGFLKVGVTMHYKSVWASSAAASHGLAEGS